MIGVRTGFRAEPIMVAVLGLAVVLGGRAVPAAEGLAALSPKMSLAPAVPPERVAEGHLRRARELASSSCELAKKCDWLSLIHI